MIENFKLGISVVKTFKLFKDEIYVFFFKTTETTTINKYKFGFKGNLIY